MSDSGWNAPGQPWQPGAQQPGQPPQPGQAAQPGWGQGVPPQPWAGPQQEIPNYLVWSILTTLFCCLPAGIVSIVYAAQVSTKQAAGDIAGALQSSKNAKTWAIVAASVGGVVVVLYILFVVLLGGLAAIGGAASSV